MSKLVKAPRQRRKRHPADYQTTTDESGQLKRVKYSFAEATKIFNDDNEYDLTQFKNTFFALKTLTNIQEVPNSIKMTIAIFATGDVILCGECKTTDILALYSAPYNNQYTRNKICGFGHTQNPISLHREYLGWDEIYSKYFYCNVCVSTPDLLQQCHGVCGGLCSPKHLHGRNNKICGECIGHTNCFILCERCGDYFFIGKDTSGDFWKDNPVLYCAKCPENINAICPCDAVYMCLKCDQFFCKQHMDRNTHLKDDSCDGKIAQTYNDSYYEPWTRLKHFDLI